MSGKLKIEPRVRRLKDYIEDIEKGLLQIPPFQRDKAWDNNKRKDLFDSLKNGYPIGSLLLWKPEEDNIFEKNMEKVGPYTTPLAGNKEFYYILDGFQRLSTLFGCLLDKNKTKLEIDEEEWKKEFFICYDLKEEEFFIPRTKDLESYQVPIYELIDTKAAFLRERELRTKFEEEQVESYMDRYRNLGSIFIDYSLPSVQINGGGIEDAVEIFSRVNSKGSIISPDWMVSALSYNKDKRGFRLGSAIDVLIEELKAYNFENIKREIIFQCIINSFGKAHFDQMNQKNTSKIEKLVKRADFVEVTKKTIGSIKKAVQFLFENLLVLDSKLLPYGNHLVFITDFFNQVENPTNLHLKKLEQWFWITTYANYFTIYSLSKQRAAYLQFQDFLKDEEQDPVFNDRPDTAFSVFEFPPKIFFGSVRAKALVLFLLNYSNDFKKIETSKVEGLNMNYLFVDIKDEKGNLLPEGVLPTINFLTEQFPKSKDMSFMLENYNSKHENYFLTSEMYEIFKTNSEDISKRNILDIRKRLIVTKESDFVETLGLKYEI